MSRLEFSIRCGRIIAQFHERDHRRGVAFPEVNWPAVVAAVLPQLNDLSAADRVEFIFRQMQTGRTVRLFDGSAAPLRQLRDKGCLLGIASNAQAYTLRELGEQLAAHDLSLEIFDPQLCLWSFQNGFSKPNPHVFQILTARLEQRGIAASEALVVGDRLDNDIQPAEKFGFQVWQLADQSSGESNGGNWQQFAEWMDSQITD